MCGITGAVWTDPEKAIDRETLRADVRGAAPSRAGRRGHCTSRPYAIAPGYGLMPGVALGHRRLAIIDLAGGHQPMANEDGSV